MDSIPDTERVRGWKLTARRALESLAFAEAAGVAKRFRDEQAETPPARNTVVELDAPSQEAEMFLIPIPCLWLDHVRLAAPTRERLRLIIIVEETRRVLYRNERRAKESVMNVV